VVIRDAEALAVALLQNDAAAQFRSDALEVQRMDGEAAFVRFPGGRQDAQGQLALLATHFFFAAFDVMSREVAGAAAAFLSARFSLMDLPAFLDAA